MDQRKGKSLVLGDRTERMKNTSSGGFLHDFNVISLLPSYETNSFALDCSSSGRVGSPPDTFHRGLPKLHVAGLAEQSAVAEHLIPGFDASVGRVALGSSQLFLKNEKARVRNSFSSINGEKYLDSMVTSGRVAYRSDAKPTFDIPLSSTSGRVDGGFWRERGRGVISSFFCQPLGVLYSTDNEDGIQNLWELPQGQMLEECISIDQNHSVLTGFEKGKQIDERSIRLSTSHKLGVKHLLATQYATDLKGDSFGATSCTNFNVNTSHSFLPDSTLSTSLHTNSSGDCSFEVEFQRERKRGNQEVLESFMVNPRTGDRLLKFQSKNMLKGGVVFMNSVISNLRDQHALRFSATTPLRKTCSVTNSFFTDLRGNQKICMNALKKIQDHFTLVGSFATNLKQEECVSLEARHELDGLRNMVVKLSKEVGGPTYLDVTSSLFSQKDFWLWAYRNSSMEGQSLAVEWRREVSSEHFLSVRASVAEDWICRISTEICLPC
ncbi:hypothetical protein MPTK1_1g01020 [Marchantia polymorpha subsp. ruderalis]|uniref:Uncharacterized protein n=2 Tax=Marchantia polymorpha TaxID=3197 RepID=A0AAF6AK59_MARPO|nr:hypothetical protein MARPO_0029s0144 [Marchantia polymorpha]PTQ42654.1 hypothetical protein MARPO_0029s0144 [Marchantia polymorpha]BBM96829.1 hypothetical protein Mp_1g01020 [Marchantia polymorpha subsp. ruderalis]BBM96830.1 hypothetical protein Mp_1g01020 [Marchantia polymorpha subsp. ruderalis]|eukprot:PTQ42653.1 hypothetical protein MARPO_0029s0144 [Marchantia polymorpha]